MVEATNLLTKIAQGDRNALSQLYDRYSRLIYAIAWKSLNSVEDCEEVVLEVFAQVWRIADRFDAAKGSPEQVNTAIAAEKEIAFPTISVDPLEAVEIAERRQEVLAALSQIPPAQRQMIEMAYYKGLTHTEIAAATGLSLGTVKTRLRLGLSKLRIQFDSEPQLVSRQN
jgi:RNA polymerase sigma-70 factor, ECF subfamily